MNSTTTNRPAFDLITSPTAAASGAIEQVRKIASELGGNLRAPHHTAGASAVAGEMALAAGGVLLLDDPADFPRVIVRLIGRLWQQMAPTARPHIVVILRGDRDLERFATLFDGWNIAEHTSV